MYVFITLSFFEHTADEEEGEGKEGGSREASAAASRITLSYQSTREVATDSHDARATVDINAETDVRVGLWNHPLSS